MKRLKRRNQHHRIGLGHVEMVIIIASLALVAFVGIGQLGSLVSDDIGQTADGIGDPAQLAHHSRFTGEPYSAPENGSSDDDSDGDDSGGDNGGNSGGNNGGNSGGNSGGNNGGNSGGNNGGNGGGGWGWFGGWFGW